MKIFTKTYEISDEAFNFLTSLKNGYAEYRDREYSTLEEFQKDNKSNRSDAWFLSRNANGTYKIAIDLYSLGFLEDVEDAWHVTYKLSDLGEEAIQQITSTQYIRNEKLEKLEINI